MSDMTRSAPTGGGEDDDFLTLVDDAPAPPARARTFKVAVIDDDAAVQDGTRFALYDYELDGHGLELLSARSAEEGRALLTRHPDIAVILLDVVMETETAGLDLVDHIRRVMRNDTVRIILRTGQPGQAPERDVIVRYDINDYKGKTELTAAKLFTTLTAALRSYQQLQRMVETRRGLEIIIDATATLGDLRSLHRLAEGVLTQIGSLLDVDCAGILVLRENREAATLPSVLAGSGRYSDLVGRSVGEALAPELMALVEEAFRTRGAAFLADNTVLFIGSDSGTEVVVVLDSHKKLSITDNALLGIFCNRLSASIDNLVLYERLQEANRTLEDRVARRTAELASANLRLYEQWQRTRRAKALQSEILGTVAHDLKNPLSVVMGRTEILTQLIGTPTASPERCLAQVEQVRESARRMTAMVDRLVADAMEEALDIVIRREPGDLARLVEEVVEANQPLAARKRQRLDARASGLHGFAFDYDRMRDALDNLVSNAIKYSPVGEEIHVAVEGDAAGARISVSDRGPGLQPEDFSRLFGRFQRLSAKPTGGESSTGLGLFSARRIVELHGGEIEAVSPGPGRGTTFTIHLPAGAGSAS